jgi:hypothetical protein
VINLPDVTLFAFDNTPKIDETIKALYTSMNGINYGSVKLVTSKNKLSNIVQS